MKRVLIYTSLIILIITVAATSAFAGYFSDVTDAKTESAVEQLRMLGVIDGMGNGKFEPNGTLTRAQFCKMAIVALREEGNVSQYKNYTIFPDVRQNHWATGYINMSVRSDRKFISGFPDGTFKPDTAITYGQAVTILMRLLGYEDKDVGLLWPDGYINAAKENGLTDGITAGADASITRAQAAQLFANMLSANNKNGTKYIYTVSSSVIDDVILLSNTARAADGTENAILTTTGTFKPADKPASEDLLGEKGSLVLNEKGRVLTFIPDSEAIKARITVSSAGSGYVLDEAGIKTLIASNTKTYYSGEETQWGSVYSSIRRGTMITVYYGVSGAADYVFIGGGYDKKTAVISANASVKEINSIVSSGNYSLYRNGAPASIIELCKYDVATYDEVSNRVEVSNFRLTAVYEDAYPNFTLPEKITVLGAEFEVLPSAVNDLVNFKSGQQMTLLFTADGIVASVLDPTVVSGNAKGIVSSVSGTYASIELTNGVKVSGNPHLGYSASNYAGKLVTVSSAKYGDVSLGIISAGRSYGDWNIAEKTLGSYTISSSVDIYEYVEGASLKRIDISELSGVIPSARINYVEVENGKVTLVIIRDVTGNSYSYGIATYNRSEDRATLSVETAHGMVGPVTCRGIFTTGEWIGIALTADGQYEANTVRLTKVPNVPFSIIRNGSIYTGGETYSISDDVQCYNDSLKKWISLDEAKRFAEQADIYVSNGVVRAVVIR